MELEFAQHVAEKIFIKKYEILFSKNIFKIYFLKIYFKGKNKKKIYQKMEL